MTGISMAEYMTINKVAEAFSSGDLTMEQAVEYIASRWQWPVRTVEMLAYQQDLDYPEFGSTMLEALAYGGPLADSPEVARRFIQAVAARVREKITAGEIPPRPSLG